MASQDHLYKLAYAKCNCDIPSPSTWWKFKSTVLYCWSLTRMSYVPWCPPVIQCYWCRKLGHRFAVCNKLHECLFCSIMVSAYSARSPVIGSSFNEEDLPIVLQSELKWSFYWPTVHLKVGSCQLWCTIFSWENSYYTYQRALPYEVCGASAPYSRGIIVFFRLSIL